MLVKTRLVFRLLFTLLIIFLSFGSHCVAANDAYWANKQANEWESLGEDEKAIEAYTKAISLQSNDAWTYIKRGDVFKRLKQNDKALHDYASVLRMDPTGRYAGTAFAAAGNLYNETSKKDKALACYNKALLLTPNHEAARMNRGLLYFGQGNYDKAANDLVPSILILAIGWFFLGLVPLSILGFIVAAGYLRPFRFWKCTKDACLMSVLFIGSLVTSGLLGVGLIKAFGISGPSLSSLETIGRGTCVSMIYAFVALSFGSIVGLLWRLVATKVFHKNEKSNIPAESKFRPALIMGSIFLASLFTSLSFPLGYGHSGASSIVMMTAVNILCTRLIFPVLMIGFCVSAGFSIPESLKRYLPAFAKKAKKQEPTLQTKLDVTKEVTEVSEEKELVISGSVGRRLQNR